MNCPKCKSTSTAVANMALSRGLNIGTELLINASVLKLVGPKQLQPDWLFYVVGPIIISIGLYIGNLFKWELEYFWGLFIAVGSMVLIWPILLRNFRNNRKSKLLEHAEFLKSHWFCYACGNTWPSSNIGESNE